MTNGLYVAPIVGGRDLRHYELAMIKASDVANLWTAHLN